MSVDRATAKHRHTHAGADYVFCGARCAQKFAADPARYLAPAPPAPPPAAPAHAAHGTVWTCPMHPEVQADAPGPCPICGMALEPAGAAEHTDNPELRDMTRRFCDRARRSPCRSSRSRWAGLLPPATARWVEFLLASPIVLWAAAPFFARAVASVRNRALNMFSLIGLGVAIAYGESVAATLAPGFFPGDSAAVYYESASVIVVLVLLGQVLELRAREGTRGAIRALMDLAPKTARRIGAGGREDEVPVAHIRAGELPARAAGRERAGRRRRAPTAKARSTRRWSPAKRCRSRKARARSSSAAP